MGTLVLGHPLGDGLAVGGGARAASWLCELGEGQKDGKFVGAGTSSDSGGCWRVASRCGVGWGGGQWVGWMGSEGRRVLRSCCRF